jgi:acid stress-induced BolA-like protein IbaG/YrbA
MQAEQVQALLQAGLEGCDIEVRGDGSHFEIQVVGEVFDGLRPVRRQQLVYAVINEQIASGAIHAVNIRALTPAERAAAH